MKGLKGKTAKEDGELEKLLKTRRAHPSFASGRIIQKTHASGGAFAFAQKAYEMLAQMSA
jgi:hypothetical protein